MYAMSRQSCVLEAPMLPGAGRLFPLLAPQPWQAQPLSLMARRGTLRVIISIGTCCCLRSAPFLCSTCPTSPSLHGFNGMGLRFAWTFGRGSVHGAGTARLRSPAGMPNCHRRACAGACCACSGGCQRAGCRAASAQAAAGIHLSSLASFCMRCV